MASSDRAGGSSLDDAVRGLSEQYRPAGQPAFANLVARRRRQVARRAGAVVVAVALGAGAVVMGPGLVIGWTAEDVPPGSAAITPLVETGSCAALVLTAGPPDDPKRWPISRDGAANRISMSANSLLYLTATGPCRDKLRLVLSGPVLQGADSEERSLFNAEGVAVVVSHPGAGGNETIDVFLDCKYIAECGTPAPVTSVQVDIAPATAGPTELPGG